MVLRDFKDVYLELAKELGTNGTIDGTDLSEEMCDVAKKESRKESNNMDYAVTLEFDRETENIIQEIIDEVAKVTGCDYMKQSKIPPHVTVSALVSENEEALLSEMESIA